MCARPLGSKNKTGMSFEKRMKVLQKIALDPNEKSVDRLNAIKLITDLLQDKVRMASDGSASTIIQFENTVNKPQNNPENIPALSEEKPKTVINKVTNKQPIEEMKPIDDKDVTEEENIFDMAFKIEKDKE